MSESRERFLRSILEAVPAERVAEIHLFPAIRQGGMESGVAVVAAAHAAPLESLPEKSAPQDAWPERHVVYTARYLLTLKGSERGRWEFGIVEEAEAPLTTVDDVVRGVQRRSGDSLDPERLTAEAVRALVSDPGEWPATTG